MGAKTQQKEIGGRTYTVTQLLGFASLRMLNRIARALAPALAKAAGSVKGSVNFTDVAKLLGNVDMTGLGDAVGMLFEKLTEDELEGITKVLLGSAWVDYQDDDGKQFHQDLSKKGVFDLEMQGRTGDVLQLLIFAFEVNYGSFFGALRGSVAEAMAEAEKKAKPSSSPET